MEVNFVQEVGTLLMLPTGPFYKKQIRILEKVGAMNTNFLPEQGAHAPLELVK